MPPKKEFFKYSEESLLHAVQEINEGAKIRETARKYGIPHSKLINKIKLRSPIVRKMGPPSILTPHEEELLCRWINAMAKKGFPINKQNLMHTVHDIVSKDNRPTVFKDNLPGRTWFESFLKRHPNISQRHSENIDLARSRVTEADIRTWHSNLYDYLKSENALDILDDPDRIINCDEAGFQTNPSNGVILGPKGMKNLYGVCQNSKENITVLGTFAASGKILPPAVVYPYERIPRDIAININEEWSVGKSKNGWMTCKVFYGYIANTLLPFLQNNGTKFPVLLLVDGHRSHISGEVSKLCMENGIILYALYPNSTHILQPADVSVFRPLKNNWKLVVQNYKLKTGTRVLTRSVFAPLLEEAFKAATPSTIANGFRKCGLYPFNADAIDYSRCINDQTRHDIADKPNEIGPEHFLYIESLMRRGRAEAFRAVNKDEDWTGEESAKELFYVWRNIEGNVENEENIDSAGDGLLENQELKDSAQETIRPIATQARQNVDVQNIPEDDFLKSADEVIENQEDEQNQPDDPVVDIQNNPENDIFKIGDGLSENEILNRNTPEPFEPNKPENSQIIRKVPSVKISTAFAGAVVWPTESPIKHEKKRNKFVYPDAISSPSWVSYWDNKEKEKKDKDNKKVMRAEKRKLKEQKKIEKIPKSKQKTFIKKRRPVVCSDTSDSEDNEVLSDIAGKIIRKKDKTDSKQNKQREADNRYDIGMFVIVQYEGEYFPGIIQKSEHDYKEVSVMVLSTPNTFKWPEKPDTIWYKNEDIIEKINPPLPINQRGSYKVAEMAKYLPERY